MERIIATVHGITYADYLDFCLSHKELNLTEKQAEIIWDSISVIISNQKTAEEIKDDYAELKDAAVTELDRLLKLIDMISSCHKNLKRWEVFGQDYRKRIAKALDTVLIDCLQEFHEAQNIRNTEYVAQNGIITPIIKKLSLLPTGDRLIVDKETGLVTVSSLNTTKKAVKSTIADIQAIDRENLTGKIVRQIYKDVRPKDVSYLTTYDILSHLDCIPEAQIKRFEKADQDTISNYIRAFINLDKKHPPRKK